MIALLQWHEAPANLRLSVRRLWRPSRLQPMGKVAGMGLTNSTASEE